MKRSKKVTIGIIVFFIIVATVIGGRTAMGVYFKNKFSKRPPPGVVVEIVSEKGFSKTISETGLEVIDLIFESDDQINLQD